MPNATFPKRSPTWPKSQLGADWAYYDPSLEWGSANPADPAVTARVLTIMWAYEY
ncbi:DUF3768 domain-containing protein [Sphingobium yanoikuyae]|uniref:DUF3768 domain-containing protein n=1 Tax=Sphingobium yanoikuyae TaxID=13690 RepID=UPI0035C72337